MNIDLNKKLDSRAKYLADFLKAFQFQEALKIQEPTFHQQSGHGSSKIDYIFINQRLKDSSHHLEYKIIEDVGLDTSSHLPLFMSISCPSVPVNNFTSEPNKTARLLWDKCDNLVYTDTLQYCLDVDANSIDQDSGIESRTQSLHNAAEMSVPES